MNVQILEILDDCKVLVEVDDNRFIAVWKGETPEKNKNYTVELDIDEVLIWGTNIFSTKEKEERIIQEGSHIKIIAKLDYDIESDLSLLKVYDSIILVDVIGLDRESTNAWVEINCYFIKLYDANI